MNATRLILLFLLTVFAATAAFYDEYAIAERHRFAGMRVAIVLCGANIDPEALEEILREKGS